MAKRNKIHVTDHARVRFMERVLKVDINELDQEILTEKGWKCTIVDKTVVTVLKDGE